MGRGGGIHPFMIEPQSRARVAELIATLPTLESQSPATVQKRTAEALRLCNRPGITVVETERPIPESESTASDKSNSECEIQHYSPDRIDVHATLEDDGLVVLADAYAEGWTCEVTNRATGETTTEPILRTNRVMRGVWLPAGEYDVVFRYRPTSFYVGAVLSAGGWLLLFALAGLWLRWRILRRIGAPWVPRKFRNSFQKVEPERSISETNMI